MDNLKLRWRGVGLVVIIIALVVVVGVLAVGCGSKSNNTSTTTNATPVPGGTYNYPLDGEPVGIDPTTYQESVGYNIVHQVYEGLFKYVLQPDGSEKTVNNICDTYTVSPDATVWTFKLKHGVMFQPPVSTEVTAQDFVDSWNAVVNPANEITGTPAYLFEPVKGTDDLGNSTTPLSGVKALDKYTLQVTLKYPFAEYYVTLAHPIASVWPVAYAKQIGLKKFRAKPVGTGPYIVQDWVRNQYLDLVANQAWWQKSATNGPFVDKVHLPEYNDTSTQWLAFQKGDIDISEVPVGQVASATAMAQSKGWIAKKWPSLSVYFVCFNMKDPVVGGTAGLPLRQALNYACDRNTVINLVREGVPLQPNGVVPAGIPGWTLSSLPYPYDPAKAQAIVAKLGKIPTLQYWYNTGSDHDKIAAPLQAEWAKVGINIKLTGLEWGTYLATLPKAKGDQLYRLGWIADYPSMDNFLYPLFNSKVSGVNQFTYYANPQVDQLISTARGTTDDTQRLNLYAQAEKIILNDSPVIPLYFYREFRVSNPRVANQNLDPFVGIDFWKVWVTK